METQLHFIEPTTWDDVWQKWKAREEDIWREHYTSCGFDSWDAWREKYCSEFALQDRAWQRFELLNPEPFVLNVWAGGYKGWKKYLPEGVSEIRFKDLIANPEVGSNKKIQEILNHFPQETEIILLKFGDQFVLWEGMHRCSALAFAAREGRVISGRVTAAVTELRPEEFSLFERAKREISS